MSGAAMVRRLVRSVIGFADRLRRDQRGNVLMIVGLSIVPLTFSAGMAIDYSRAMRLQTKLNAAADAAALAAVTRETMNLTSSTACATAKNMFVGQIAGLQGLNLNPDDPAQLKVTVTDSASATSSGTTTNCSNASGGTTASYSRSATVTYRATSTNAFAGILGATTLTIQGKSTAYSAIAPDIDFYIMMDTSPSMLLPATSDGLAKMVAATKGAKGEPEGCTFGCHLSNPKWGDTDTINGKDFYQVAVANSIVLRTDLVGAAIKDLTALATQTSATNNAIYRMGLSSFDYKFKQIWPNTTKAPYVDGSLTTVSAHVGDAQVPIYCTNNNRVCNKNDNDTTTNFTRAFDGALGILPTASGGGTKSPGDTPQAILFIITDGMRDECNSSTQATDSTPECSKTRLLGPIPTAKCTTIKNRGVRIAILNTKYLPESATNQWSIDNVKTQYLTNDALTRPLMDCASPGLFYQVTTDESITDALKLLFQKAVASARLIQ